MSASKTDVAGLVGEVGVAVPVNVDLSTGSAEDLSLNLVSLKKPAWLIKPSVSALSSRRERALSGFDFVHAFTIRVKI